MTFSQDGTGAQGATVGVVVIGENALRRNAGRPRRLSLAPEDVAAVEKMKAAGIPVVVLISGRPMIDPILDKADAFVAAWLPGTEGEGVADVLFGDYKPTGKLSFNWEKQFAFGYG